VLLETNKEALNNGYPRIERVREVTRATLLASFLYFCRQTFFLILVEMQQKNKQKGRADQDRNMFSEALVLQEGRSKPSLF
jgi:hypothetical protein